MKKDDIYAFPVTAINAGGMTLRDYFAAKAMQAIIIGNEADECTTSESGAIGLSKDAYIIADSMLKER